ncbi:MAG: hypothetical protein RLZZ136_1642 [Pseudomonadota bacterium]|jgi:hypothetical protein
MSLAGTYAVAVKTPMGPQNGTFTVVVDGDSFTGALNGDLGSMAVTDGKISGNTLVWSMDMKVPLPVTLQCEATVDGDAVSGTVKAGVFGTMAISGNRVA